MNRFPLTGRQLRASARGDASGRRPRQHRLSEWQQRRLNLMAWIQVTLLVLLAVATVIVMCSNTLTGTTRTEYLGLILVLAVLMGVAIVLNRSARFTSSALVTVAAAVAAPWGSLVLDPAVLQGELMPLTYVIFSVILSAMLLGTTVTVAVAAVQWLGLLAVAHAGSQAAVNWTSLVTLVFFISVLAVLGNIVIQRDLREIHRQASRLATSEAELRHQSVRDPLTDLFNRRYLQEALDLEIGRARRSGLSTSLMIIDLDHFKELNDTFGHAAGDGVLRQLGTLLMSHFRTNDVVCRFGGDEFVIILPETPIRVALARADRLGEQVRRTLVIGGDGSHAVTLSIGVAAFPRHGSEVAELLHAADTGLYRAKADGRDCVREADSATQRIKLVG